MRYEVGLVLVEKPLFSSFQRYMTRGIKIKISKFQNFGHVNDDVITGHATQISEIKFDQKVPPFILGKVPRQNVSNYVVKTYQLKV